MKPSQRRTLFAFFAELLIYGIFVAVYFLLVLHFLGGWLAHLDKESAKIYGIVCLALIIGQAVALEWVTTFLFRLLRGRSR
jgi:hypothetical protein